MTERGTTRDLLVGLDVGTTSSKAVVYDVAGAPLAVGRAPTTWAHVEPAVAGGPPGVEVDADALLAAAVAAVGQALDAAPAGRVAGLGVTSMAESGVLLDGRGRAVAPVVAWHDSRDLAEVARLGRDLGAEAFSGRTGLPLRSQWSLTKHRWQRDTDPAAAGAVRRLNVAEWVVRGLGGDEASDASLASRTGWLDLATRDWWPEAVAWSGASEGLFPPLVTSGTALGRASAALGLPRLAGAVLTTAGHDHQAATVGAEAAGAGDQLDSCGTAEALVRTVPAGFSADGVARLAAGGVTVGWHVLAGRWALLGATEGGLALQRVLVGARRPSGLVGPGRRGPGRDRHHPRGVHRPRRLVPRDDRHRRRRHGRRRVAGRPGGGHPPDPPDPPVDDCRGRPAPPDGGDRGVVAQRGPDAGQVPRLR